MFRKHLRLYLSPDEGDGTGTTDNDPVMITVAGKEYTEDELKGHVEGSMRQSDYTTKTQELAEQQRAVQELATIKRLAETDPESARLALDKLFPVGDDGRRSDDDGKNLSIAERKTIREMQQRIEDMELERHITEVKNDEIIGSVYKENEKAIHKFAIDNNIGDLRTATESYAVRNKIAIGGSQHRTVVKVEGATRTNSQAGKGSFKLDPHAVKRGDFSGELSRFQNEKSG